MIEDNWTSFSPDRRLEIRKKILVYVIVGNMLIQYIETNGHKLDSVVLRGISTSIGLISKLSWISDRRHRSLFESIEAIIDLKGPYLVVGLNMMSDFVEQMNLPGIC